MLIREMREYLGKNGKPLSTVAFSRLYLIPVRTLENWESEKKTASRKPPEYLLYLLERAVRCDKKNIESLLKVSGEGQIKFMSIQKMREYLGKNGKPLSTAAFSRLYKIPVRTLENWEAGNRKPKEYLLYLLERAVKFDKMNETISFAIDIPPNGWYN